MKSIGSHHPFLRPLLGSIRTIFIPPLHIHSRGHRTFTVATTNLDLSRPWLLCPLKKQSPTRDVLAVREL